MTGALQDWRVLVPRGGEWGEKIATLLTGYGARPMVVPLIEFGPPDDVAPLDQALERLAQGAYDWLVVTSATTVLALSARAATVVPARNPRAALAAVVGGTRVAAVGPGTASALERDGITTHLLPGGERSARGLLADFPGPPDGSDPAARTTGRVLAPHSDLAEPTLPDGLRAAGWQVDDVIAYRTTSGPVPGPQVREEMRSGRLDAVLLGSASTVTAMLELVGRPPATTVLCCIGPRTERAAVENGLTVHVVPPAASAEELVEALAQYAQENR